MGMITITLNGSFGHRSQTFSAMDQGHAAAVAKAIGWLADRTMQEAIINDHRCHADGIEPKDGFAAAGPMLKKTEPA
jgi:hypothetical protein